MTIEIFKNEIQKVNAEINSVYYDLESDVLPIGDGPLDPEAYFNNQSYKILWLMKEPYEEDEREGGWSLPDFYIKDYDRFYTDLINGPSGRTWQPVVYASYGILNDFKDWDEMSFIRDEPSMVKILDKIAWINIQKLPSISGKKTNIENIQKAFTKYKDIIKRQIDLFDPQIIICGNTFSVIKEEFGNPVETKFDMVEYITVGQRLVINAYHPAQFRITRERYVNNIIGCTRDWTISKNLPR